MNPLKNRLIAPTAAAVLIALSSSLQSRTWTGADGMKTFEAELQSYDAANGKVSVILPNRKRMTFTQDKLSDGDIAWLKKNGSRPAGKTTRPKEGSAPDAKEADTKPAPTKFHSADWPMWRYDFERTAESPQKLPAHLDLLWQRDLPTPQPAFNDIRLQFDRGYEPVAMGSRLFLASSSEDKVSAYDTNSGALLWQFFCNGPVRLAPVAWNNRIYFGSDDGNFYCVGATAGKLIWKFKAVPSERKLIGNRRLISVWPIRGGPVLKDDRVYFAAGVWPFEGVFLFCLDATTGEQIWVNDSAGHLYGQQPHNAVALGGIAPQGYLLINEGDLVVPCSNAYPGHFDLETGKLKEFKLPLAGRYPGGWYVSLPGKSEQKKTKRKSLLADIGVNVMRHEDRMRSEGNPETRTTIRAGDREFRFKEGFPGVKGEIYSIIAADNKLFISTLAGGLYAFGKSVGRAARHWPGAKPEPEPSGGSPLSVDLLSAVSLHGYSVFLGAPDLVTIRHLVAKTDLHLIVVESEEARVESLRSQLLDLGISRSRVAISLEEPGTFEMPPYFANFIFISDRITVDSRERVFESVRPYGGQLISQTPVGLQTRERTGSLPGSTNYQGDFAQSPDALVKAPLGVLWFDDTLGHFKRSPQPKIVDGIMVSTDKDWLDSSTRERKVDYRLLPPSFSDVYTGRILTEAEALPLKKLPSFEVDQKTVQPSQYRPPAQKDDWKPDAPVAGYRQNPLTGETEPRRFPKSYGCDGGFDYGNIYTMRSGTASFYDKRIDSGTINISGPRSGCTNSIIPANGVLNLPYFYKGCTCSYPLPTGLSMYSLPESHEQWTTWGASDSDALAGKIQRVGINLGAPADRMTEKGTLWLDFPSSGGPSPDIEIETVPAEPKYYYRHSLWMRGGEGWPWVAASGVEDLTSITIKGLRPGSYDVHLTFANPSKEARCFDVILQERLVSEGFNLNGEMMSHTKAIRNINSDGAIKLDLKARAGSTQLSGIEIISTDLK